MPEQQKEILINMHTIRVQSNMGADREGSSR